MYTTEELAGLATRTAAQVGFVAVRWWQDRGDPCRLWIEATRQLPTDKAITIVLEAILPDRQP
jgi:hypothetical protein